MKVIYKNDKKVMSIKQMNFLCKKDHFKTMAIGLNLEDIHVINLKILLNNSNYKFKT